MDYLIKDNGMLPTRKFATDAGVDLYSTEDVLVRGLMTVMFSAGTTEHLTSCTHRFDIKICVEIPYGHVGLILDKSGRGDNLIKVFGGVIDCGYRNTIQVRICNFGLEDWHVESGMAIAQMVIVPCDLTPPRKVQSLSVAERDMQGFGSKDLTL